VWRTLKYEAFYLKNYADIKKAFGGLEDYFMFYNEERSQQTLRYKKPHQVYHAGAYVPDTKKELMAKQVSNNS